MSVQAKLQDIIDAPAKKGSDSLHNMYSLQQLVDAHNICPTKLRAALDSCLVAAELADDSGFTHNARAIRAVVAYIERATA